MSRVACRYAIVRFMPYVETGEFANVGVVLVCPSTGYFGFRLEERRYGRVTKFFESIEPRDYTQALKLFKDELCRVQAMANHASCEDRIGFTRGLFERLIHPREAVIQFAEARAVLADDPLAALEKLYKRYVEHDFGDKGSAEQSLVRKVQGYIHQLNLGAQFKADWIGNDGLKAKFPFVQRGENDVPLKVIKPFFLAQDTVNDICDHAGNWVYKLEKMRKQKILPEKVLFPVHGPSVNDGARYAAFLDIVQDLQRIDIQVVEADVVQKITEFALH